MSIEVYYGNYQLIPAPIVQSSFGPIKMADGENIGSAHSITLDGYLVDLTGGLPGVLALQNEFRDAFNQDGQLFEILCDEESLFKCYPRIRPEGTTFNPTPDNWVKTCTYQITLDFDLETDNDEYSSLHPPFIQSVSESWQIEPVEDKNLFELDTSAGTDIPPFQLRVTRNISAQGVAHWDSGGLSQKAWEQAKDYVENRLAFGFNPTKVAAEGVLNLTPGNLNPFNHVRSITSDEREGSYSVTESWLVLDQGGGVSPNLNAIEDFTVEARINRENADNFVSIQGTIEGLETRTYSPSFSVTEYKYSAAKDYWDAIADSLRILPRAQAIGTEHGITLNVTPVTKVVTHSPSQGIITYSYEYDDKCAVCIPGAKTESIVITDNHPTDVFASLTILGRPQGSLLQDLGTYTTFTRDINIEIIMEKDCDCPDSADINSYLNNWNGNNPHSEVNTILCEFQNDLTTTYTQVFRSQDTESWNPVEGRYTRNVQWTATNCASLPGNPLTCS